jgi:hypothetical protein
LRLRIKVGLCLIVLAVCAMVACSERTAAPVELRAYSLSSTTGVLTSSGVELDDQVTSDGDGSLRLTATAPTTFRLFETGDVDVEDSRLVYGARVRTLDVAGEVYLEMWCHFAGKGEFFSRSLHAPLSGTVDWTTQETPFFLRKGENPDNVKLNLVINGSGTAWIDDIHLMRNSR